MEIYHQIARRPPVKQVQSYLKGQWQYGQGKEQTLHNPITGSPIATACTEGLDLAGAKAYAQNREPPLWRR